MTIASIILSDQRRQLDLVAAEFKRTLAHYGYATPPDPVLDVCLAEAIATWQVATNTMPSKLSE